MLLRFRSVVMCEYCIKIYIVLFLLWSCFYGAWLRHSFDPNHCNGENGLLSTAKPHTPNTPQTSKRTQETLRRTEQGKAETNTRNEPAQGKKTHNKKLIHSIRLSFIQNPNRKINFVIVDIDIRKFRYFSSYWRHIANAMWELSFIFSLFLSLSSFDISCWPKLSYIFLIEFSIFYHILVIQFHSFSNSPNQPI